MSSGTNTTRKSSVASGIGKSSHTLRHHNEFGGATKRQKVSDPLWSPATDVTAKSYNPPDLGDEEKESSGDDNSRWRSGARCKNKFVGVRQRPSGRWVAEIKDTTQKIRLWLGTFDTAVDAARAYDEAAWLLRGANTRTNFLPLASDASIPSCKAARLIRLRQNAASLKSGYVERLLTTNIVQEPDEIQVDPKLKDSKEPFVPPRSLESQQSATLEHLSSLMGDSFAPSIQIPYSQAMVHQEIATAASSSDDERIIFATIPLQIPEDKDLSHKEIDAEDQYSSSQQSMATESLSKFKNDCLVPYRRQVATSQNTATSKSSDEGAASAIHPVQCYNVKPVGGTDDQVHFPLTMESEFSIMPEEVSSFIHDAPCPLIPSSLLTDWPHSLSTQLSTFVPDKALSSQSLSSQQDMAHLQLSHDSNKEDVSLYIPRKVLVGTDDFERLGVCRENEAIHPESSFTSSGQEFESTDSISYDENECCTDTEAGEMPLTSLSTEEDHRSFTMNYSTMEAYSGHAIRRERDYPDLRSTLSLSDFMSLEGTDHMSSGWSEVNLGREDSGVYTSAFDFSAELALDRGSCTSVLEVPLVDDQLLQSSEQSLRVVYEGSDSSSQGFEEGFAECVLLTESIDMNEFSSSQSQLGSPLIQQGNQCKLNSSSHLWKVAGNGGCGGQYADSAETTGTDSADSDGEGYVSQDQALWSSMDLSPLCMVA